MPYFGRINDGGTDTFIPDGTIQNKELVNSTVNYGGVTLSLGSTSSQPAFDLTNATNYPTSSLTGTITNAQLAGSISNDRLLNSTISYGGVQLSLGGSDATPAFDLTDATSYGGALSGASDYGSLLRSDQEDEATQINIGGEISSTSNAKLQVQGFQRTGPIMLAQGTTGATSFNTTNERWFLNDGSHVYASTDSNVYNNKIWTDDNHGADSGLDADKLDGQDGSYYLNSSNLVGLATDADKLDGQEGSYYLNSSNFVGLATDADKLDGQEGSYYLNSSNFVGLATDADKLDGQEGSYYLNTSTSFGGDVSGTYNAIEVTNDSHTHAFDNLTGKTSGTGNYTTTGTFTGNTLASTVASGTAPLTVTSTTLVSNLNADKLDGEEGSYYLNSSNFVGLATDADKLDGQEGSYYLNSSNFVGLATDADKLDGQQGSYYLNYNNFTNTPTIPTNNNQLTNGAGYITSSGTAALAQGLTGTPDITVGIITGSRFISNVADGTAPLTVTSTTLVSNLNADKLDGQEGSYYLNTSTSFGGDVSGTYNAIEVTNDSHTHDTRYYTETESDARFLRGDTSNTIDGNLTVTGLVGIGTNNPLAPVDVTTANGRFLVREDQSDLCLDSVTTTNSAFENLRIRGTNLIFQNGSDERVRVSSSGNFGIGTPEPQTGLSNEKYGTQLEVPSNGTDGYYMPAGRMYSLLGRVVSGTDSWVGFLAPYGNSSGSCNILLQPQFNDINQQAGAYIGGEAINQSATAITFGHMVASSSVTGTSTKQERMRIDSSGFISLAGDTNTGFSSPSADTLAFTTGGSERARIASNGQQTHNFDTGAITKVIYNWSNNTTGMSFRSANTERGNIYFFDTGVQFNTTSDYRLKENVTSLDNAAQRVRELRPKRFNFIIAPDKTQDGFLAHEVQQVVPEAITGEKDAIDVEGNPVYQGIDHSKLVPLLTAALQEALGRIEILEAEVQQLKGQ